MSHAEHAKHAGRAERAKHAVLAQNACEPSWVLDQFLCSAQSLDVPLGTARLSPRSSPLYCRMQSTRSMRGRRSVRSTRSLQGGGSLVGKGGQDLFTLFSCSITLFSCLIAIRRLDRVSSRFPPPPPPHPDGPSFLKTNGFQGQHPRAESGTVLASDTAGETSPSAIQGGEGSRGRRRQYGDCQGRRGRVGCHGQDHDGLDVSMRHGDPSDGELTAEDKYRVV